MSVRIERKAHVQPRACICLRHPWCRTGADEGQTFVRVVHAACVGGGGGHCMQTQKGSAEYCNLSTANLQAEIGSEVDVRRGKGDGATPCRAPEDRQRSGSRVKPADAPTVAYAGKNGARLRHKTFPVRTMQNKSSRTLLQAKQRRSIPQNSSPNTPNHVFALAIKHLT